MFMQGHLSSSLQWGAWAGVGMAAHDLLLAKRLARVGMGSVFPKQGLAVLQDAISPVALGTANSLDSSRRSMDNVQTQMKGHGRCMIDALHLLWPQNLMTFKMISSICSLELTFFCWTIMPILKSMYNRQIAKQQYQVGLRVPE